MIIFENGEWQADTSAPDTNYLEGIDCRQPKWVVPDNSELAGKIMSTPYWKPVEDENGVLADIIAVEPPVSDEESILSLKSRLEELDRLAVRPLRAILTGNDTGEDREILTDLEKQAEGLREQLAEIEEGDSV